MFVDGVVVGVVDGLVPGDVVNDLVLDVLKVLLLTFVEIIVEGMHDVWTVDSSPCGYYTKYPSHEDKKLLLNYRYQLRGWDLDSRMQITKY